MARKRNKVQRLEDHIAQLRRENGRQYIEIAGLHDLINKLKFPSGSPREKIIALYKRKPWQSLAVIARSTKTNVRYVGMVLDQTLGRSSSAISYQSRRKAIAPDFGMVEPISGDGMAMRPPLAMTRLLRRSAIKNRRPISVEFSVMARKMKSYEWFPMK